MLRTNGRFLLFSLIVAIAAGLLFTPGLPGGFVFDDHPNIVSDQRIHLKELDATALYEVAVRPQISGFMRILPTLSFAIDYWRGGGADPATFKTTNIVIHALTALALAWFFRSLLLIAGIPRERVLWMAPALALAWAAHPLQVSAVLYTVQRIQTMGTLFLVLALCAYLQARQAQIEGRSGRTAGLLTALLWILALGCKEDSVLLPAYTLALELTVLRFAAADARLSKALRYGYLTAVVAGAAYFLLVVVPHRWRWDAYSAREFSTPERLLTQARVLCMYLGQILVPLPRHMPFYYDWIQPSRGLLTPWTTLPALTTVAGLLALAWSTRRRWPLFALGVLLFFAAHSITSNIVGLELAFEHRNHFALVGAVLAMGCVVAGLASRLQWTPRAMAALSIALLLGLGGATLVRAYSWHSNLSLAQAATAAAPSSARAWVSLCAEYLREGGGLDPGNPMLDQAIDACTRGTKAAPSSLNNPALLLVLKTVRGDVSEADWSLFHRRLQTAPMTWDNRRAPRILSSHHRMGVALDKEHLIRVMDALVARQPPKPFEMASLGYFIMNDLAEPDLAMPYFIKTIEATAPNDPFPLQLAGELRDLGRPDLANTIEQLARTRFEAAQSAARTAP